MANQVTGLLSPWLRKKRIEISRSYIKGRVLDYGCGVGMLAEVCLPDAYLGVDHDKESIQIARKLYPNFRFELDVYETEKFDTIVSLAVIEHVSDPEFLLKKFRMMLKPDGCIVLTTPHSAFEPFHTVGAKVGLFSTEADEEHEHLIGFTLMHKFANLVGLRVVEYKRFLFGANQLFVLKPGVELISLNEPAVLI